MVVGRTVIELTGRLTFVARILTWLKPFLAPLHSWTSVLARGTACRMTALVHLSLIYIRAQLEEGHRLVPAPLKPSSLKQAFRTDAKCERGRVVLGGWLLGVDANSSCAKWFCVELTPEQAPWLFKEDGTSQWASSSAELLATYMAFVAFAPDLCVRECVFPAVIMAGTDSRSNPQALEKGLSMKWPLMGILMQFSSHLAACGGRVKLQWRRERRTLRRMTSQTTASVVLTWASEWGSRLKTFRCPSLMPFRQRSPSSSSSKLVRSHLRRGWLPPPRSRSFPRRLLGSHRAFIPPNTPTARVGTCGS